MTLQPLNPQQINRLKRAATIASVTTAISLSLLKTFGALYTGSFAVLSSMIDSLADIFASSVTYIAVKYSSKPASDNHRYGYGKAEALSALIQSAFIAGSGIFVMYDGFSRLLSPKPLEQTDTGILIMSISLAATIGLILFQKYVTRRTKSQAIAADSAHYTVDMMTNASIILSLLVVKYFDINWFDTLTAFIISTYLLINAYHLARGAVSLLMDEELGDDIRTDIISIVRNTPISKGIHDLRTRDLGGSYMFEFHLELDGNLSLYDAHDLTDMVEDEILEAYPNSQIIIHQDPAGIYEERLDKIILKNKKKNRS